MGGDATTKSWEIQACRTSVGAFRQTYNRRRTQTLGWSEGRDRGGKFYQPRAATVAPVIANGVGQKPDLGAGYG